MVTVSHTELSGRILRAFARLRVTIGVILIAIFA